MFWSTLVLLLAAAEVRGKCVSSVQQVAVSRMRETANPLTWLQMAAKCRARDNSVLLQSHARLSDSDKELCANQYVPLGFFQNSSGIMRFQEGSFSSGEDRGPGADLLGEHEEALDEVSDWEKGYAALDLETGRWHIVSPETTFGCALCQKAPIKYWFDYETDRLSRWSNVALYRVSMHAVNEQAHINVEANMDRLIAELDNVLPSFDGIAYRNASNSDLKVDVRVSSGYSWDLNSLQNVVILDKFLMSVTGISNCSDGFVHDNQNNELYCDKGTFGEVCVGDVNKDQVSFTTMECSPDYTTGLASWNTPLVWQFTRHECSKREQDDSDMAFPYLIDLRASDDQPSGLLSFVYADPSAATLDNVSSVVSRELRTTNELDTVEREYLEDILEGSILESYVVSRPGVQMAVGWAMPPEHLPVGLSLAWGKETEFDYSDDAWQYPRVEPTLVYEYHHVTAPRPQVAIALSSTLIGRARRVAYLALWPQPDSNEEWDFDGDSSAPRFLDLTIMVWAGYENLLENPSGFVDLTYSSEVGTVSCAARIDFVWDFSACTPLKSLSKDHAACRCATDKNEMRNDGITVIRIALKTPGLIDEGVPTSSRELLHSR